MFNKDKIAENQKRIDRCKQKGVKIFLNKDEVSHIKDLAKDCMIAKLTGKTKNCFNYKQEAAGLYERWIRGFAGEMACEKLLNTEIIEWVADDQSHEHPDILSINVGVKTARTCDCHLLEKIQTYPQILCICDFNGKTEEGYVWILGLATPEVMMSHQDDELILSRKVYAAGYKTGFWGYDNLLDISNCHSLIELTEVINNEKEN